MWLDVEPTRCSVNIVVENLYSQVPNVFFKYFVYVKLIMFSPTSMLQLQSCYMMFDNANNVFTTKNIGWCEGLQPCVK
jgi:hypothetical protein